MANLVSESSLMVLSGGQSQAVSISTTSAQSAAIGNSGEGTQTAVIYSTVECFMRQGANPTALATGVDQIIPASTLLRLDNIVGGNRLAFITPTGSGTVYITPGA